MLVASFKTASQLVLGDVPEVFNGNKLRSIGRKFRSQISVETMVSQVPNGDLQNVPNFCKLPTKPLFLRGVS